MGVSAILHSVAFPGHPQIVEWPASAMKRIILHALISASTALASCASPSRSTPAEAPASTVFSTPAPGERPTALPSPTPPLVAEFQDLTLIPGRLPGDWSVIGLVTNRSTGSVGEVELNVGLYDANDTLLAHQVIRPALAIIGPEAQSPFTARFAGAAAADHAQADVVAYQPADRSPAPLQVDQLDPRPMGDGRTAVYGRVVNIGPQTIEIEELVVMATTLTGGPIALSETAAGISFLRPGETAPFVTVLASYDPASSVHAFSSARSVTAPADPALSFPEPPRIEIDQEGSPLVIGIIRNDGADWTTADVVVSLRHNDELAGLAELRLPWPLAPGETQAFLLDEFPGLVPRMRSIGLELTSLAVMSQIDPAASRITASTPISLDTSVTAQEVIRGTLFLKGSVTNGGSRKVDRPSVVAVLRSTRGEVLSSGFVIAGAVLEAGDSLPFILTLRLPDGVDLGTGEFDVRAAGFPPE